MKEISDINGWMTSGRFIIILKYDITAVYKIKVKICGKNFSNYRRLT